MKKGTKSTTELIKAQAAAELAIFGSLILILFSTILSYGQRFDFRQQVKMEAFRRAMQESYYRNASVSYTYKRHSRMMDLFTGFGQGQAKDAQSSASVMWVKGLPGVQDDEDQVMHRSFSLYNINESMIDLPKYPKAIISRMGEEQTSWVPVGVYSEDMARRTKYTGTREKHEREEEGIVTVRGAGLQDELKITLHTRYDIALSSELVNPINRYASYIYEGQDWYFADEAAFTATVAGGFEIDQVAEIEGNRISFRERAPGEETPTIRRERTWTTSH